ncbi:MAG: PEP-CTERM sorting domain-containing protein [Microcystis sp. M53600_WE12]|nr:PEP-CTERM sorting domain-containing protein [Microcystis sp. M53600_WE12]
MKPVPEPSAVLGLVTLGLAGYSLKKRGNSQLEHLID